MIDNFDQIISHLTFENDTFYRILIIKRRKENPSMTKTSKTLQYIYIYEKDDVNKCKDKIINICLRENARAYFDLTPRSLKKVALKSLVLTSELLLNEQHKSVKNSYDKAFGNTSGLKKYFLIDYDNNDKYTVDDIVKYLDKDIILDIFSTLNGSHIVTKPFDRRIIRVEFPDLGIQKQALTLLYYKILC